MRIFVYNDNAEMTHSFFKNNCGSIRMHVIHFASSHSEHVTSAFYALLYSQASSRNAEHFSILKQVTFAMNINLRFHPQRQFFFFYPLVALNYRRGLRDTAVNGEKAT